MNLYLGTEEEVKQAEKKIKEIKKKHQEAYREQYKATIFKNEKWKDIREFDGYQVSNYGRVRRTDTQELLMLSNYQGYNKVKIQGKNRYIHRLVAEAFIPNPNNYPCVNHINEIKVWNTPGNLEWCTHRHNNNHATVNERRSETMKRYKELERKGLIFKEIPTE